jgi:membrane-bound serine protease (ClpP class)
MDFLLDPNILYVLLAGGLIVAVLALLSPGTGLLEVGALFLLFLAGWGIYYIPFNWWALVFIAAGVVLFVLSVRTAKSWGYLVVAIMVLVIGSVFLFYDEQWWMPAVDPILAALVSILSAGFFWIAARKTLEANSARPTHDLNTLIGAIGEAKTHIHDQGSVQVNGELWSAHSQKPIPNGAQVRVVQRDGFILEVEAID